MEKKACSRSESENGLQATVFSTRKKLVQPDIGTWTSPLNIMRRVVHRAIGEMSVRLNGKRRVGAQ